MLLGAFDRSVRHVGIDCHHARLRPPPTCEVGEPGQRHADEVADVQDGQWLVGVARAAQERADAVQRLLRHRPPAHVRLGKAPGYELSDCPFVAVRPHGAPSDEKLPLERQRFVEAPVGSMKHVGGDATAEWGRKNPRRKRLQGMLGGRRSSMSETLRHQ